MFSALLKTNFVNDLKKKAEEGRIKDYWDDFKYLFEEIEKYIGENIMIISDVDMLIGEKMLYKNKYVVYCSREHIERYANDLTNKLAQKQSSKKGNEMWIQLRTGLPGKNLDITYKGISLIVIKTLSEQNINMGIIVQPIIRKGFYTDHTVRMMPQEIELIDVYKKLYSPNYAEDWEKILKVEPILVEETGKRISTRVFAGGFNTGNINVKTIQSHITLNVLNNSDFVLVGEWAIKLIEMGITGNYIKYSDEKVQIITKHPFRRTFELLKSNIKDAFPDYSYEIIYKEQQLYLPDDYRTKRFTIYIQFPSTTQGTKPVRDRAFMDVFTNAMYELIPWIPSDTFLKKTNKKYPTNVKIGNPYVLLRFLMIDLWTLRIIYAKNYITKGIFYDKIKKLWNSVLKIRDPARLGGIINKAFSLENYEGVYSREDIYFKNLMHGKYRPPPYNPYSFKKKNGQYRKMPQ